MALEDYKALVGNKSVFSSEEIESFYSQRNLYVLEIVYDHAFGEGNNVNYFTFKNNGIWKDGHPSRQCIVCLILNNTFLCKTEHREINQIALKTQFKI